MKIRKKISCRAGEDQLANIASNSAEGARYFEYAAGNATEALKKTFMERSGQAAQVAGAYHNGLTFGETAFKGISDYFRGDKVCTGLCVLACTSDAIGFCYCTMPWLPGRLTVYTVTKGVSTACVKFRDKCAASGGTLPGC